MSRKSPGYWVPLTPELIEELEKAAATFNLAGGRMAARVLLEGLAGHFDERILETYQQRSLGLSAIAKNTAEQE